jgi:oxygen-independent coproporphyrinogen-3 oxidase
VHGRVRFANESIAGKVFRQALQEEYPVECKTRLSAEDEMSETMFLGLRLTGGVDLNQFYGRFGRRAEDVYRRGD